MSHFLICASPAYGHVAPMLSIGRDLVGRGHRVTMLTGSRFASIVSAAGIDHVPLPVGADIDHSDLDTAFPERRTHHGVGRLRFDIEHIFVRTMPHQAQAVASLLGAGGVRGAAIDAVISEGAFTGTAPLALGVSRARRVPVISVGVIPMASSSVDTAPFGLGLAPVPGIRGRMRNRLLNLLVQRVIFGGPQRVFASLLREAGVRGPVPFLLDIGSSYDRTLQLTVPGFEYPRSDLAPGVRFIGPVPTIPSSPGDVPEWWSRLDGSRPIVHVTQGTVDNADVGRLIRPTMLALAASDVTVVVSTGGSPVSALGELPANVVAAEFIPYDALLPRVDVMVTNGGYGGVHLALAHGVPLVVAGDSEDKPEVAARVAWSGAGVNLRTGVPTPAAVLGAVEWVLGERRYREAAERLAREIEGCWPFDAIDTELAELLAARRRV